jgi:2'-5' RNA ligase
LAFEPRDYPEWHRGRDRYAVWLIDADLAPLCDRVARARAHLGGLLADAQRQPHVTVFVCGFLAEAATWNDDFTPAMLARQRRALEAAAVAPFELEIGGLASFDSAVFLEVRDPDHCLAPIRAALAHGQGEVCPHEVYTPHLTVGLYRDAFDKPAVTRRLAAFAEDPPRRLAVTGLHFAVYPAQHPCGLLETREVFPLSGPVRG